MTEFAKLGQKFRNRCRWGKQFASTFNRSLREFVSPVTGFDVVKFDDEIIKAVDGESTKSRLLKDYGEDALKMVQSLIEGT